MIYFITFFASFLIQALFFAIAFRLKSDKFTDITYSLTFVLLGAIALSFNPSPSPFQYALFFMVLLWAARLGSYLLRRVIKTGRDKRFDGMRENFLSFASFWALQALAVWVIMLPQIFLISEGGIKTNPFLFAVSALLWLKGFIIEAVSDAQKYSFRNNPANRGRWIDSGMWKYSRHPNFFGESLMWWALFLAALPHLEGFYWLLAAGPVFITVLLLFVSGIPTVEKQSDEKYGSNPDYASYRQRTSIFIPFPPKREKP